jgi:transcription termination factor Rho
MDEVIFEEFKGTGNMELVLERKIADRRIFPALDVHRSGTRREELLLDAEEMNRVYLLRNYLGSLPAEDAITFLLQRMGRTASNREFFAEMARG